MKKNKFRKAIVLFKKEKAGVLEEIENGYRFTYDKEFIKNKISISISLPIKKCSYENNSLFPFFIGLLPEGWYLDIVCATLKIDKKDTFGLLLGTCKDTIGAVMIKEIE